MIYTYSPRGRRRLGMTWDGLIQDMDQKLKFPGMLNILWMPIQTRTEMRATGIRSALGIKVFGADLATIAIENALQQDERTAPFTRSAFAERSTGGYFLDFTVDRAAAARYGLNVGDMERVIMAAMGGQVVSQTVEGRERYNVLVRYARDYRDNVEALERVLVPTPTGAQIPIAQVADIAFRTGPPAVRSEDGLLGGFVFVDVKSDIGIADYVEQAKQCGTAHRRTHGRRGDLRAGHGADGFPGHLCHLARSRFGKTTNRGPRSTTPCLKRAGFSIHPANERNDHEPQDAFHCDDDFNTRRRCVAGPRV